MRVPFYKALSTNNKDWIYGFPLIYDIYGENWIADYIGEKKNIKKSTLCEYTGLKDLNGNKVFEYDILSLDSKTIGVVERKLSGLWVVVGDNETVELNPDDLGIINFIVVGNKYKHKVK